MVFCTDVSISERIGDRKVCECMWGKLKGEVINSDNDAFCKFGLTFHIIMGELM